MAAVEVTISGVLFDKVNRTTQNVVLIGEASLTGIGVGGGPIIPPEQPGKPPGIWGGGNVPMPNPPIANVPGAPGYEPPNKPPEPIQPPVQWKAVWHPTEGWIAVGVVNPDTNIPHPAPSA